jgi:hypothetical protein
MHVQAKVSIDTSGFSDDDDGSGSAVSATYRPGALGDILRILAGKGLSLRVATGRQIELGGHFGFYVADRDDGEEEGTATREAVDLLKGEGFDAYIVEVQTSLLDDISGSLLEFVDHVSGQGLLIEEIAVATPDPDGRIPVQIYTVKAGGGGQTQS